MRVALVHYHLLRGGVSSVLRRQARVLRDAGIEVLVLSGEVDQDSSSEYAGSPLIIVPELNYDSRQTSPAADAETLARSISAAIEGHWSSKADLIHIHNPLIRKNALFIPALRLLVAQGQKLLLQNHDFAEDFRPDVYVSSSLYPENCHYAAINGRDFSFLRRAGLELDGVHLLPNAVSPLHATEGLERTRYLYPVRAIRRKNIGEALLLSLFLPPNRTIAITLPPTSSRDEKVYLHWKDLAKRMSLPVEFEAGDSASLADLLGTSVCALSTSVKEGFGFSFLEPWTAGREVIGRRLDYVCTDFEKNGIRFDNVYNSLEIPLVYLPVSQLREKLETALIKAYTSFGMIAPPYVLKRMTDDLFSKESIDFGRLDEESQTDIIETLCSNTVARVDVADANPFLAGLSSWEPDEALIAQNRERVLTAYSAAASLAQLFSAYTAATEKNITQRLSKAILLELFLDPLKLSLVGAGND